MVLTEQLKYFMSKIDSGKVEVANGDMVKVMSVLEKATKSLINKF